MRLSNISSFVNHIPNQLALIVCRIIFYCDGCLDGDDAGLFTLERNPDNSARLLVKGRIDRESVDSYLLTVKCFKPAEKPSELRKPYNPLVNSYQVK
jgi:hypothetical protein